MREADPGRATADPIEGSAGRRYCLVVSRYHGAVTSRLEAGAREELIGLGADPSSIEVVSVPGAFELPWAACRAMASGRFDGIVALGCVIRGETPHFDYVCRAATDGLARLAAEGEVPVGFGLLTCDTVEQASARAGGSVGNKGTEAARAVAELCALAVRMPSGRGAEGRARG